MRSERWGLAALLTVTIVWGTTFPAMKLLSGPLSALEIIWLRFLIASCVLLPLWRGMRASESRWGLLLGTLMFIAFWLQVEGLTHTSSNRNAFVTGLNVLVVPLLAMVALGRRYGWRLWLACGLALGGMFLMFFEDAPWSWGDSLTLASTLFYAIYILVLEEAARRSSSAPLRATRMAAVQACVMLGWTCLALAVQDGFPQLLQAAAALEHSAWLAVLYLGLIASVIVVTLQAWGQQRVDAMRSTIVFGLEPVFASLTAWLLIGERMGLLAICGATLIVSALFFSQWAPPLRTKHAPN